MRATNFSCRGAKISPVLRLFPGSHHMVNTNEELKEKKVGNGSQCKCKAVRLKSGAERVWKNWDGHKVHTVSIEDVEWVEFEHHPSPPKGAASTFRLKPKTFSATVNFPLTSDANAPRLKLGSVKVVQIPVNCDIATTGHKLQGMSKDFLVVNSWAYKFENWVYVVLSRVRTRRGLFLNAELDRNKKFKVPKKLLQFEARMKEREKNCLQKLERLISGAGSD